MYQVHCATAAIARKLCGVTLEPGIGMATRLGSGWMQDPLATFRALAPYRTQEACHLRRMVAATLVAQRALRQTSEVAS